MYDLVGTFEPLECFIQLVSFVIMRKVLFYLVMLLPICSFSQEETYYAKEDGKKLDWAMYYINEYYVDSVNSNALVEAALKAVAAELDPYSVYQSAEELRKQKENDEGTQFIGIGTSLIIIDNFPHITAIVKGSAAQEANLQKGDIIIEINGKSLERLPVYEVTEMLKGNPGTDVELLLFRDDELMQKKLSRARVPLISVETSFMLTDDIGYIKMIKFTQKTIEEFTTAYKELQGHGMEDLVLDMRGNNGGVFPSSIALSSLFLKKGSLINYTDGVISDRHDHICEVDGELQKGKIIILTDGYTASASEVFCGAIQDWDRALIIGAPTFGKGLIQQSYGFSDSSALRLTISKYFRPTGNAVQRPNNNTLVFPSEVYVGSESADFLTGDNTTHTMSGRKIYSLGAGVVPDVFYPNQFVKAPAVPYKYMAEYFFDNKDNLRSEYPGLEQMLSSDVIQSYINQKDATISGRDLAEVKGWLAALIFQKDQYYETIAKEDKVIREAIKRMNDGTFDRLGIRY